MNFSCFTLICSSLGNVRFPGSGYREKGDQGITSCWSWDQVWNSTDKVRKDGMGVVSTDFKRGLKRAVKYFRQPVTIPRNMMMILVDGLGKVSQFLKRRMYSYPVKR